MWNDALPLSHPVYPRAVTLFEAAHAAGYSTAMAAGKAKFDTLAKPNTIDYLFVPDDTVDDNTVTAAALEMIAAHQPNLLFVHLPSTDTAGHARGWASPEQMAAIENADACIGRILDAYAKAHLLDSTFVLVTADHGGAGLSHGPDDPRSRHIPWITSGPGIRQNYDLTRSAALKVVTEDTFATTSYMLGLPIDPTLDGHPVLQILDRIELLQKRP
jgi:phosphopentomutase